MNNLTATGILWYSIPNGGLPLSGSTSLVNNTNYFSSQTVNGVESINRFDVTVTINSSPTASPSFSSHPICSGLSTTLSANASQGTGNITMYAWSSGILGNNASGSVSAAGTYTVTVTDANSCSVVSTSPSLVMWTNPSASASVTTPILCNGNNGVITVSATGGTTPYTGTGTNNVAAGTYSYAVTDHNGCHGIVSQIITQPVQVAFTVVTTNNSLCTTTHTGSITVTASGGTGTKIYSDNGGTSYQGASLFNSLISGSYIVVVKDANGCLSSAATKVISSNLGITFTSISIVNATTCSIAKGRVSIAATGSASIYNFSKDGGTTWQSSNIFKLLAVGTYSVQVKDPLGCFSAITPVHLSANTGGCRTMIEGNTTLELSNTFTVYPNPANDHVIVSFTAEKLDNYSIRLIDIAGRIIYSESCTSVIGENQYQMDLSQVYKGIYMVIFQNSNGTLQKKIVVN